MKEIKFRHYYPGQLENSNFIYTDRAIKFKGDINNSAFLSLNDDGFAIGHDEDPHDWSVDEDINQYTGLKDKNGVEIYEGDIIDYGFKTPEFTELYKGKIFFEEGMFMVDGDNKNNEYHLLSKCSYLKVIGNIYENKDLIK